MSTEMSGVLPKTNASFLSGRLTLKQVLALGAVATPDTEDAWIGRARRVIRRRLEDEVSFWIHLKPLHPPAQLGLNVGDVSPDGREVHRRVVLDPATTKGCRPGEVFLSARLQPKLRRFLAWKRRADQSLRLKRAPVRLSAGPPTLAASRAVAVRLVAATSGVPPALRVPPAEALGRHRRLQGDEELVPGPTVGETRLPR